MFLPALDDGDAPTPVLWASTPDASALVWQPSALEVATSSAVGLNGGAAGSTAAWQGPTVHLGGADLVWQPTIPLTAASAMVGAGFMGQGNTLSALTMHLGT